MLPAFGYAAMNHINFVPGNIQNYQNQVQPSNTIYLLKESNKFNIFE